MPGSDGFAYSEGLAHTRIANRLRATGHHDDAAKHYATAARYFQISRMNGLADWAAHRAMDEQLHALNPAPA